MLAERVFREWPLPAWASRTGFRLLDPVKSVRSRLDFIMQLHDREALLPRERQRRFLEADGWVAWPGPAMADFLEQFIAHNRMLEGGFVVDETSRDARRHRVPDPVGRRHDRSDRPGGRRPGDQPGGARARRSMSWRCAPGTSRLVVGSVANSTTWPAVAGWVRLARGTAASARTA